jgi:hypothetical protein
MADAGSKGKHGKYPSVSDTKQTGTVEPVDDTTPMPEATSKPEKAKVSHKRDDIIRGRMPIVVVYAVKHGDQRNETTAALAKLFGTTTGKIDDIKKERGFKYVKDNFAPTALQKADGIEYLKRHPEYSKGAVDKLIDEIDSYVEATPDEAKAFEVARASAHGQPFRKKTGEPVTDAGGGNRIGQSQKGKATAADLVS